MLEKYYHTTHFVIIQPTPFCNINCRYCYLPYRSTKERLTTQTLSRICELLFSSSLLAGRLVFIWHAGEPMVLPMDFYEGAFQIIKDHNRRDIQISHGFQTNATLITQEWCEFIQRHQILVGVSLDGPQHLHDLNRVDRAGHGTFERALRGIRLLLANQITPSVIMVLTRDALAEPQEVLRFFQQEGLSHIGFNAEEVEGVNLRSSLETEEDIAQFQHFFEQALQWNDHTSRPLIIRETVNMRNSMLFAAQPKHFSENQPFVHLNFDYLGNISTFSPELLTVEHGHYGRLTFGNVFELETLNAIWEHPTFRLVHDDIQRGVQRC